MRLKLGSKFLLMSFCIIFISISVVTGIGLLTLEHNSEEMALKSLEHRVLTIEYILEQKGTLHIQNETLMAGDYTVDGNDEIVDRIKAIYGGSATIFRGDIRVSTNIKKTDGTRAIGTKLSGPAYDTVIKEGSIFRGEVPILDVPYYTCYKPIKDASGVTIGVLYAGEKKSEFMKHFFSLIAQIVMISVVMLLVFCFLVYLYSKRLAMILKRVSDFSSGLATGDLLSEIHVSTGDELEHMAVSLNEMRSHLNEVIKDISKVSLQLSSSSEELSASSESSANSAQSGAASTEEMTATIEEIFAGMESIDAEVSGQLDCVKQLTARLSVLSDVANETGVKLRLAGENSAEINVQAMTGQKLLDSMSLTMQQINAGSQEMLNITTIINDISEKINLLSLNASIEAARAGDAGRGFAVVAEEISKLADQTANSIKSIDTLIRGNNAEITSGLDKVGETVKAISNIVDGIETINAMLNALHDNIQKLDESRQAVEGDANVVTERADQIKVATSEQKNAMGEMVKSVSGLTGVTQNIATGSEEVASSSEEIAAMAETLRSKVDFFKYD